MRLRDLTDYIKLRRVTRNPWETLRFRKTQRDGQVCVAHFKDGKTFHIRGARQDLSIFQCVFARDDYRLDPHAGANWSCVLDIGGNIGAFAVRAAPLAQRVISYEPISENFLQLEKNTDDWSNIEPVQQAVAGQSGSVRLHSPRDPRGTGRYSMYRELNDKLSDDCQLITAVTLNDVFESHKIDSCDLLKLDVEGAEYEILYAASDKTLARVNRIHAEYHNVDPDNPDTRIDTLSKFLCEHGFETEIVPRRKRVNQGLLFAQRRTG